MLEIGFGAGHNLPFYDNTKVRQIWALEPSLEMRERAKQRVAESSLPLRFIDLPGEQIPLHDDTADTVLVTYTLCTIPDVARALKEMRRVLKPGGKMIFCEHGEAPDAPVKKWQDRLTPVWKKIGGGCHLGRPIPKLTRIADSSWRRWRQCICPAHHALPATITGARRRRPRCSQPSSKFS